MSKKKIFICCRFNVVSLIRSIRLIILVILVDLIVVDDKEVEKASYPGFVS